jgi:2-oxoglutarate/2-oxoacid ferredoxin oxidoreductase subunit beta
MSCTITTNSIKSPIAPTWCPGCGDFMILNALQKAFAELKLEEANTVIFYGIGCSGNMADFNQAYGFHGLHGRALPNAIGAKLANHDLKIVVIAGDGDFYGEGLNHFISLARGNHDVTVVIHNNSRYSLTTGQSSPTTKKGTKTKSTPTGLVEKPFNPIASALVAEASFVSRGYDSKLLDLIRLIKAGLSHPGFSLIDVIQFCPTFNKKENRPFFAERIYDLAAENHDSSDKMAAIIKAQETEKVPLGIFYQDKDSVPYHAYLSQLEKQSLISQRQNQTNIKVAMGKFI